MRVHRTGTGVHLSHAPKTVEATPLKKAGTGADIQSGALPRWYLLQGREVVPCTLDEMMQAGGGFQTVLQSSYHGILIRTMFLAVDYGEPSSVHNAAPKLFETVVIGGSLDGFAAHRSTLLDAELTHREVFDEVVRLDTLLRWTLRTVKHRLWRIHTTNGSANEPIHG